MENLNINFLQVYDYDLNISKRLNECVKPLDGWICLTDYDTLKFAQFPTQLKQLLETVTTNDVIGPRTNRIRPSNPQAFAGMFDESDINKHNAVAKSLWTRYDTKTTKTNLLAGFCLIFHKSMWERVGGFRENQIFFDKYFSYDVTDQGGQLLIAQGLYVFHLYRWGSKDPVSDVKHLVK